MVANCVSVDPIENRVTEIGHDRIDFRNEHKCIRSVVNVQPLGQHRQYQRIWVVSVGTDQQAGVQLPIMPGKGEPQRRESETGMAHRTDMHIIGTDVDEEFHSHETE